MAENLTTYTEVDAPGRLSITSAAVTITDADRDESLSLYKDHGASHFDALDEKFEMKFVGSSHGTLNGRIGGLALTAAVETTLAGLGATDVMACFRVSGGPVYTIQLLLGPATASDTSIGLSTDTVYYLTLARAAGNDTITLTIYSDAARTTTVDTLSVSGYSTATWRYLYAFLAVNDGNGSTEFDGVIQNIDLNEATVTPQAAAGAITPTGALTLKPQKQVAGSLTPAGTLQARVVKSLWHYDARANDFAFAVQQEEDWNYPAKPNDFSFKVQ